MVGLLAGWLERQDGERPGERWKESQTEVEKDPPFCPIHLSAPRAGLQIESPRYGVFSSHLILGNPAPVLLIP